MLKKIRTIIVDDSKMIRAVLSEILNSDPSIEVIATAEDPYDAREKIKLHNPDVITLDIEMPKMNGIEFLKKIMKLRPMPVVMISSLTVKGSELSLDALNIGAVDVVHKPGSSAQDFQQVAETIIEKVKIAARANLHAKPVRCSSSTSKVKARTARIVAIGASTGGTETIRVALEGYSTSGPPVVISQHIPPIFSSTYAQRLSREINVKVIEVTQKTPIENGTIYLAQGGTHMVFEKSGGIFALPNNAEKVNKHRPSVDVMFNSLIPLYGKDVLGFLLTGMGADGAQGLLNMKNTGAYTIAQDEETSVVWGMPRQAVALGGASEVMSITDINQCLRKVTKKIG